MTDVCPKAQPTAWSQLNALAISLTHVSDGMAKKERSQSNDNTEQKHPLDPESTSIASISQETREQMMSSRNRALNGDFGPAPEQPKEPEGLVEYKAGEFVMTEEMQKFKTMMEMSGQDLPRLDTETGEQEFVKLFNQWIRAGRPQPTMPKLVMPEDPYPRKIYRFVYGKMDKLFWVDNFGKWHGRKEIGEERYEYTQDFSAELANRLIKDARDRGGDMRLCFKIHPTHPRSTYAVNQADFNVDRAGFDNVIITHQKNQYRLSGLTFDPPSPVPNEISFEPPGRK